jgi:hypothetical protein
MWRTRSPDKKNRVRTARTRIREGDFPFKLDIFIERARLGNRARRIQRDNCSKLSEGNTSMKVRKVMKCAMFPKPGDLNYWRSVRSNYL